MSTYDDGYPAGDVSEDDVMCTCNSRIEEKLDAVLEISQRVETLAQTVAGHVKPVLDDLMKSPLLKMLGVKK